MWLPLMGTWNSPPSAAAELARRRGVGESLKGVQTSRTQNSI